MSLRGVAQETLKIIEDGGYVTPRGEVDLSRALDLALDGTVLYDDASLAALTAHPRPPELADAATAATTRPVYEVTRETTAAACRRLAREGIADPLALNFASAKNPGGGFLSGARAQEEDLARVSALYACQIGQRAYYDANRASSSFLYTNHLIYSPRVPFFRDDDYALLEAPHFASIITSPAPNAGEYLRREADADEASGLIEQALRRRAEHVLRVARAHGHHELVLGAWGCGVFRNDPEMVAAVFGEHLESAAFAGAFRRVVFAVFDRSPGAMNRAAFEERFVASGSRRSPA
jgi:uncharacterized protein (TIGR02452 family)